MVSRPQFEEQQDPLKVESIQASLDIAVDFAMLALPSTMKGKSSGIDEKRATPMKKLCTV
jgi:hypothetical protein